MPARRKLQRLPVDLFESFRIRERQEAKAFNRRVRNVRKENGRGSVKRSVPYSGSLRALRPLRLKALFCAIFARTSSKVSLLRSLRFKFSQTTRIGMCTRETLKLQ